MDCYLLYVESKDVWIAYVEDGAYYEMARNPADALLNLYELLSEIEILYLEE